jgi:hypothetical protein
MATWCVYYFSQTRAPYEHVPKLVIRNVPEGEVVTEEMLESVGYYYEAFNIPWANHVITQVDAERAPADPVIRASLLPRISQGEGESISWDELQSRLQAKAARAKWRRLPSDARLHLAGLIAASQEVIAHFQRREDQLSEDERRLVNDLRDSLQGLGVYQPESGAAE